MKIFHHGHMVMHMVAVVAVCRNALVDTGWPILGVFAQVGLENTALTL